MKRNFLKCRLNPVIMCLLILLYPLLAYAEGKTETEVSTYSELSTAMANGENIKLTDDITLEASIALKSTLNLNGHTLNTAAKTLVVYGNASIRDLSDNQNGRITGTSSFKIQVGGASAVGNLIFDSGILESALGYGIRVVNGSVTVNGGAIKVPGYALYNESSLTINGGTIETTGSMTIQNKQNSVFEMNGGTVRTTADYNAINFYGDCSGIINGGLIEGLCDTGYYGAGIGAYKNTQVTINGGTISSYSHALYGNGSVSGNSEGTNAKFIINGGSLSSVAGAGVYAPQVNGETIISSGTITGQTAGVEVRAGKLTVTGGTISGNKDEYEVVPNDNGLTTKGSAISVRQHTTKQPINVNISGGVFYGKIPFSESNPLNNSEEDVSKISYDISGGVFHSSGDKTVTVDDMHNGKFISGGKYTHYVTPYVKDGYGEKPEDNMIAVYKWRDVNLNQSANGSTTVTRNETTYDDGTTIHTEPYETSSSHVKSLYADEIYISPSPDEDSALLKTDAVDLHGNVVNSVQENMYLMPDDDLNITAYYVKMISREIDPAIETDKIDIGVRSKDLANAAMLNALKQDGDLLERVYKQSPVLELIISEKDVTDSEKNAIFESISAGELNALALYDIYVAVKDKDGNELARITQLPEDIEFVIVLPKSTYDNDKEYYISGNYNGYKVIDSELSNDDHSIKFKTNLMSQYALVDASNTDNPKTGEDKFLSAVFVFIPLLGWLLFVQYKRVHGSV